MKREEISNIYSGMVNKAAERILVPEPRYSDEVYKIWIDGIHEIILDHCQCKTGHKEFCFLNLERETQFELMINSGSLSWESFYNFIKSKRAIFLLL